MNKLEALKKTLHDLKAGTIEYNWNSCESCNCGVVARTLLNGERVFKNGFGDSPSVKSDEFGKGIFSAQAHCMVIDLPLPKVFQALKDAGFTHQELVHLEFLSSRDIISGMDKFSSVRIAAACNALFETMTCDTAYNKKEYLISYLESWIRLLEKDRPVQPVQMVVKYVVIPGEVSQNLKQFQTCEN